MSYNQYKMKGRYQLNTEEDVDEGFEYPQNETEQLILQARHLQPEPQSYNSLQPTTHKKSKIKSSQKHVLKLDSLQITHVNLNTLSRHSKAASLIQTRADESQLARIQESENRSLIIKKKRNMDREGSLEKYNEKQSFTILQKKREIGQDLVIKHDSQAQELQVREQLKQFQTATVVYRHKISSSTHTYFKHLSNNQESKFVDHKYNTFLKQKLDKIKSKPIHKIKSEKDIEFKSDFQSGNLELSFKVSQNQYNLFLRIDTHTNGHQNWFYFKVINHQISEKKIKLNICNLKRKFKMIEKGQKIFISRKGIWTILDEDIQMKSIQKNVYKLSFSLTLLPNQSIFIALIPPYTYSQLLEDIGSLEKSSNVKVQVLTYSVSGLAIPIITISKNAKRELQTQHQIKKKLFLISGRIHPSQTCSSYIINGLIQTLLSKNPEIEAFLTNAVVKIIPMMNPDGVVFGNFRTSYLGDDLNRSFHQSDEAIYPEVTALKQLVKNCKNDFGQNFLAFIDMHGHSCRTNSFVYGPEYEQNCEQFIECRIFPKIFDKVSKYFSYDISSFKLQQYKCNTARGHFFRKYKIPSYTIQTSYALFQAKNEIQPCFNKMSVEEWAQLGNQLAQALQIYTQYIFNTSKTNSTQVLFKKKIKQRQDSLIRRNIVPKISFIDVHNEIQQQISQKTGKRFNNDISSSDSDGDPAEQDLSTKQKQALIKSVKEVFQTSYLLPKVMKPTMILPSIVPSIIVISKKQKREINMVIPKLSSKIRHKKFARPLNYNNQFNEYLLRHSNNVSSIRPDVINFSSLITKKLNEQKEKKQYKK